MGTREESNILEAIENFVDMIDTTTMTPRLILHNEASMTVNKVFREFDVDSGEDCGPWTLCSVTNAVAKLGRRFLRK